MVSDNSLVIKALLTNRFNQASYAELYAKYNPLFDDHQWLQAKKPPSAVKMYILGHHGAGKSTLIKSLQTENSWFLGRIMNVSGVDGSTIGILPSEFFSKYYGSVVLFDFAGHQEYYASHSAVLQNSASLSPPVFMLVVDMTKSDSELERQILYWIGFLENHCSTDVSAHFIIIGSHSDLVGSLTDKKSLIENLGRSLHSHMKFDGFFGINCCRAESRGLTLLRRKLHQICDEVRSTQKLACRIQN